MHLIRIDIENLRSLTKVAWRVKQPKAAGWHVVIGDNGAGKSTFLRAIALALVGPREAAALRVDWRQWLRAGEDKGLVAVNVAMDGTRDKLSGGGRIPEKYYLTAGVTLTREAKDGPVSLSPRRSQRYKTGAERHVWGGKSGWFSASFGPFRRFAGGDKDSEKLFFSNPLLARHLSLFGESIALPEGLRWLQRLKFRELEGDKRAKAVLQHVTAFVNQDDFLPHGAKLHDVTSADIRFVDGAGQQLPVEELSDGYRSILSLTFELIRQQTLTYGETSIFSKDATQVVCPGVVLIDEIDAHLHPTWQRRVGLWFRKHFPKTQFIVASHSPLVCQAADVGTVWKLASPGAPAGLERVQGHDLERLLYGNVVEAYGTGLFGAEVGRSDAGRARLARLALLNRKELRDGLSATERQEQRDLRATFPTAAHGAA